MCRRAFFSSSPLSSSLRWMSIPLPRPLPKITMIAREKGNPMPEVQAPILRRPVRLAVTIFPGLVIFVFAFFPFLPDEVAAKPVIFALFTVGYCAFLAFFGVGFALAIPSKWFNWWMAL